MSPLHSSDVLTPRQLAFAAERLPEPQRSPRGRRPYSNLRLLLGTLRVLRSGCRWRDLDRPGSLSWVTHWRGLRYRVDRTAASFQAFVYLAVLVHCVRRLVSPSDAGVPQQ